MTVYKYNSSHFPCVGAHFSEGCVVYVDISEMGYARWARVCGYSTVEGPFYSIKAIDKALAKTMTKKTIRAVNNQWYGRLKTPIQSSTKTTTKYATTTDKEITTKLTTKLTTLQRQL